MHYLFEIRCFQGDWSVDVVFPLILWFSFQEYAKTRGKLLFIFRLVVYKHNLQRASIDKWPTIWNTLHYNLCHFGHSWMLWNVSKWTSTLLILQHKNCKYINYNIDMYTLKQIKNICTQLNYLFDYSKHNTNYFQVKNRFNFVVLSIILSDFLISSIGVFLDSVGSSLQGRTLATGFCQFQGFFHMISGKFSLNNFLWFCTVIALSN